jgi:ABC-2 type transport system ATP-binding protein
MKNSHNNEYSIQTIDLTKKFGNKTAVNLLNLTIKKGELFSILGHNGAGKTTIIKMLCCLLKPTSGTALVLGHDIINESNSVKQIINVSPQETAIANHLTTYDNQIEIRSEHLVFDEIVDSLRSNGVKIDWLSMKEASLDDVFLSLNKEI